MPSTYATRSQIKASSHSIYSQHLQVFTECLREELMLAALRRGSHNKGSPQHRHFYIEIDLLEPILIKYVRPHFLGDIFLGYPELEIQDTVRQ